MAASAARAGFGASVQYLATAPSTFAGIGELLAVTPPNKSRETIDTTHMASPDGYREFIGSLRDGGESTLTFNYTEAGATVLEELFAGDVETFKITLPGTGTITFSAIVTDIELDDVVVDDKMGMSATLKVTGKPVYDDGVA
ncbi:MAG: outer capsid protein Hoc [Brevundimonas sp.]|uniref:phage tail tube protein n=1 Tax=Brevundimonas sp. TaxID=1871086 RepID=UPI00120FA094|nr:phage tail tube protein [Brevundimonas sp.]RZJ19123.1 MAG: outer capsid protein Hoc [Brevundimonas sp.]